MLLLFWRAFGNKQTNTVSHLVHVRVALRCARMINECAGGAANCTIRIEYEVMYEYIGHWDDDVDVGGMHAVNTRKAPSQDLSHEDIYIYMRMYVLVWSIHSCSSTAGFGTATHQHLHHKIPYERCWTVDAKQILISHKTISICISISRTEQWMLAALEAALYAAHAFDFGWLYLGCDTTNDWLWTILLYIYSGFP